MNPGHSRAEVPNNGWDHQATIRTEQTSRVMDEDLKLWDLYSLEGAEEPESPESMKNLFTRYRTVRGKATNHAYTNDALQRSWCAFIRRWSASRREDTHGSHVIGDLRRHICRTTRDELHMCYVHVREGCPACNMERSRPIQQEWDDLVCAREIPQHIRPWIGRYERSLSELQVSELRRMRECPVDRRGRPRSRDRLTYDRHIIQVLPSLVIDLGVAREVVVDQQLASVTAREIKHHELTYFEGPMCRPLVNIPTNGPYNVFQYGTSRAPSHYSAHDAWDLRDRRFGPQSNVAHPMHLPREEEHHDGRSHASGTNSHNRTPVPSNDELRFLRADAEDAKNGLLDAREPESARDRAAAATEAAERTRREQQGLVERLRQLEIAAFRGPQQNESARARAGLGPSRRQRRRQGCRTLRRHRRAGKVRREIRR
ncbi:unnamed protein product [Peronospora destructor]|uniref:Uncharacterized protein n=1 Tax=Peronospora destructor TaxID=86335 RepID=A0AAV0T165_9STRA|nr:unnamed protein product [Peronospora destructor]